MVQTNYAFTNFTNSTAKAYGKNLPISTKASINVCKAMRGLRVEKALTYLDDVVQIKRAIPYTRFTDGVGHRRGDMASGRYPMKAAKHIRAIIASAVANAANHGLSEELKIISIVANKASSPLHQGRQKRRAMKRTHIEVVLQEVEEKSSKSTQDKSKPKTKVESKAKIEVKSEAKQEVKTEQTPKLSEKVEKTIVKEELKEETKPESNSENKETKPSETKEEKIQ